MTNDGEQFDREHLLMWQQALLEAMAFVAVASTALYAAAALHLTLVEYPAWARVGAEAALVQSVNSFQRAPLLQTPVAAIGCIAAIGASALGGGVSWTFAAACIGLVVPFTAVVMPVSRSLFGPDHEPQSAETRRLLKEWSTMHRVRTALSLAAAVVMIFRFLMMTAH
ncbi:MAG: DUF1772 domain-containing protein [Povalibacter sp.]